MSERQEHRQRLNTRLKYAARIEEWANRCPSIITFWRIKRWLKEMPKKTF